MTGRQANLVTSGGVTIQLSHLDKVFFPDDDLHKGDLVDYYRMVAPRMLPLLRDRPVVMARYPDGVAGERILQKNVSPHFPDWVKRVEVPRRGRGGTVSQVVCDRPETLIYLANQAAVELHTLLSRVNALDRLDQLVFDLDPPGAEAFDEVRRLALDLRRLLEQDLGLTAYVKTTGGKGLHVHVPLRPEEEFDSVRGFAKDIAELMISRAPDRFTLQQRVEERGDRIYFDIQRNGYAQMAVAPYSVRPQRCAGRRPARLGRGGQCGPESAPVYHANHGRPARDHAGSVGRHVEAPSRADCRAAASQVAVRRLTRGMSTWE